MISAATYDLLGELMEKTTLPKGLFETPVNKQAVTQAVRVFLANKRTAHAKVKTRGEVRMTTAKMYRQKGTGRARHGAQSAPVFVGGGVAFGPTGGQNYSLKLSKSMLRSALLGALATKAKAVSVIVGADKATGKTKQANTLANKMKVAGKKVLIVAGSGQEKWTRAWRNLPQVNLTRGDQLNAYSVMRNNSLIFTVEALEEAKKTYV